MPPIIAEHFNDIRALCRAFGVERLEVFGSVMAESFDASRSDVDFIVTYPAAYEFGPWLARFNELEACLAALLDCPVDLVMAGAPAMTNHWFRREVDKPRSVVFDATEPGVGA